MEGRGIRNIFSIYFMTRLLPLLYKIWVNKAVVGSSRGDVPKYAGEDMALRGTPSTLGGPYLVNYIKLQPFEGIFQEMHFGRTASEVRHLICQCNIIQRCYDIICDVTALQMHWSHDHLL